MTPGELSRLLDRYRVVSGKKFRLRDHDPADTGGLKLDKAAASQALAEGVAQLSALQERLYAQDRWSVLCLFQAMDAGGKDGTIKHVMSGVNPQGVHVTSFKAPSTEELSHDFLWRVHRALPVRGTIGIHNRSHYEEVLIARVHPEMLDRQRLPRAVAGRKLWHHRLADIAAFEAYLARQGVIVLKFFLHISKDEQKRRLLARLDDTARNWKFNPEDVAERGLWDDYMHAYQRAIAATAAPHAPWFVVPADSKWFARLAVCGAIVEALRALDLALPHATQAERAALAAARHHLETED
ncbi:MAG TPA: polyphosphate kinase 2 family protein [Acetobacteraceae bacterium]|nr:polyphosphate kinase 2 family protein [Acetobacteraceae bacterium]